MALRSITSRGLAAALLVATALPTATPAAAQGSIELSIQVGCPNPIVIRPGDTLYSIARRCGTTVEDILALNPQIDDLGGLRPGLRVYIQGPPQGRDGRDRPGEEIRTDVYRVQPGDTIASIARRAGVPTAVILRLNPDVHPRWLRVGQRILVPAGSIQEEERRKARVRLGSRSGEVGSLVNVDALGFPPNTRLDVLMGTDPRRLRSVDTIATDRRGRAEISIRVPRWAAREGVLYFGFDAARSRARAVSGPFEVVSTRPDRPDRLRVTGTLTRGGVECQAMHGDDGRTYTLVGDLQGFRAGDRVEVVGQKAEISICQQGTTIEVSRIREAR